MSRYVDRLRAVVCFVCSFFACVVGPREAIHAAEVTGELLQIALDAEGFNGSPVQSLGLSDDGRWLAAASDKVVRMWDLKTNRQLPALRGYQEPYGFDVGRINSLTFSPNNRYLLVGVTDNSEAGSTRIYDLANGGRFHSLLQGHLGCTRGIAFSPDERLVATWGCDGRIIVSNWNAENGTAEKLFVTNWATPRIPDARQLVLLEPTKKLIEDGNKFYAEGLYAQVVNVLERKIKLETEVLGRNHDWVLNTLDVLRKFRESQGEVAEAKKLQEEIRELGSEIVQGGCFCFSDNETLVFSHCGRNRVVSIPLRRILEASEEPKYLADVQAEERKLANPSVGEIEYTGGEESGTFTDLVAYRAGKPWLARCMRIYGEGKYSYSVAIWLAGFTRPAVHTHSFDPVAVTFNGKSGLGASSDRLGVIHVWKLNDTAAVQRELEPNAVRLWNVAWDADAIYFGDVSYAQRDYADNHRGPLTKKLDLVKMAILDESRPNDRAKVAANLEGYAVNLAKRAHETTGKSELALFQGVQSWPLFLQEQTKEDDARPIRTLPFFDGAWSYVFLDPAIGNGTPHVLIGTEHGSLFEGAIARNARGDWEMRIVRRFLGHSGGITAISLAPDSRRFATSSLDGTLRIWQLSRPRVLADIGCTTDGSRVVVSRQEGIRPGDVLQRFGASTYFERLKPILKGEFAVGQQLDVQLTRQEFLQADGSIAIEERQLSVPVTLQTAPDLAEPMLSVFLSKEGEWVIWNDQGFFNSSPSGARHLGFHRNRERHLPAEFIQADQFQSFYRPNLVLRQFRSPTPLAPEPSLIGVPSLRAELLDEPKSVLVSRSFGDLIPPAIEFKQPTLKTAIAERDVRIEFDVSVPLRRRIKDVYVSFNQKKVFAKSIPNSESIENDVRKVSYFAESQLDAGTYAVVAAAEHDVARGESEPFSLRVDGKRAERLPNLYVVSLGVGRCRDESLSLPTADRDAEEIAREFERQRGRVFAEVETRVVANERCTREGIDEALEWLRTRKSRESDLAIVFVNARVISEGDRDWYLIPHDVNRARLRTSGFRVDDLIDSVATIPRALLLLDVFHERNEGQGIGDNPFQEVNHGVVLSCSQTAASHDGVFAAAIQNVLGGIQGRELRLDGFCENVKKEVVKQTQGRQIPLKSFRGDKSLNGYVIAK